MEVLMGESYNNLYDYLIIVGVYFGIYFYQLNNETL